MLYVKQAIGTIDDVTEKLTNAVAAQNFGLLGVHNLKQKMIDKGVEFDPECRVFEVCNPFQAKKVLESDMSIANALPCRICVYEQGDKVLVSTLKPTYLLAVFDSPELDPVAKEVETSIVNMIDAACE